MENSSLISIIIPVYNVERYLHQCIDSVINQTYKNLEIILVDDGSSDSCPAICDNYAQKDGRIIVIHKKNEGQSIARNKALKTATGKYIMFVDSDDWIDLDTCEVAVSYAEKFDTDIVFWSYIREYDSCAHPKLIYKTSNAYEYFNKTDVKYKLHRRLFGLIGAELRDPEQMDSLVTTPCKLY